MVSRSFTNPSSTSDKIRKSQKKKNYSVLIIKTTNIVLASVNWIDHFKKQSIFFGRLWNRWRRIVSRTIHYIFRVPKFIDDLLHAFQSKRYFIDRVTSSNSHLLTPGWRTPESTRNYNNNTGSVRKWSLLSRCSRPSPSPY